MPLSANDIAYVKNLVYQRSAIVIDEAKQYLLETRLEALVRDIGASGVEEIVAMARSGKKHADTRIIEAMTTHETSFFRDLLPFEVLKKEVFAKMTTARSATRTLYIWSAACSTGQEPYSLAMLINESFPELSKWAIRIIATDLSAPVLERAKEGKFRQLEVNRGLPAHLLLRYFDRVGADYQAKPILRNMIEFRQLNLLDLSATYMRPDITFMRNVLIYFDVPTKRSILQKVRKMMPGDGVLFLGAAETTLNIDEGWQRVTFEKTAYYKAGNA